VPHNVIIYTTPTWPHCHTAKEFLSQHGIQYTEYNVADDSKARDAMVNKTGRMAVPTIEVNNEVMVGFDPGRLSRLLH